MLASMLRLNAYEAQRPGIHIAAHAWLGRRTQNQPDPYPAREADAERTRRKLPWTSSRRMPERQLVRTLNDARRTLDIWRQEYNCERPHSSLAYRTPAEF